MIMKKIVSLALTAILCIGLGVVVSAETHSTDSEFAYSISENVAPAYELANDCVSSLTISGSTAYCRSSASGSGVVRITVEQTLQKYSGWFWIWNNVSGAQWTKTVNSNTISASNSISGLSSGKYRLKSVFTLTNRSGETETITVYSTTKSISQ